MSRLVKVLGIQIEPKLGDKKANLAKVEAFLEKYACVKADLVVLPEVFSTGVVSSEVAVRDADEIYGSTYETLSNWARQYKCYLVAGSLIECCKDGKCRNSSMLFSPDGDLIANYHKLHMFSYYGSNEGDFCTSGCQAILAKTPIGNIGMTVCYDLRFTELYRSLAYKGAEIITIPAAWPFPRLEHWVILNRARAIENQCFIVSVNQTGAVPPRRSNVGNSMIIDPWGSIIAGAGEKEGVMFAVIDLDEVNKLRQEFPVLNDRNLEAYANVKICEAKNT